MTFHKKLKLSERCKDFDQEFDFFIHSGSCDGENRKLYSIRINKEDIPSELIPYYNNFSETKTESQLYEFLKNDESNFSYNIENEITLNVSNNFDVYFNFTHMHQKWKIGNILTDDSKTLVQKIVDEDIPALNLAKKISVKDLIKQFGNSQSNKIFDCIDDYKAYLLNKIIDYEN